MKIVYDAHHSLDAHVVKNLLETEGIAAFVQGEHLQGGVGELAATGFVKVSVNDADATRARELVVEWESQQPPDEVISPAPSRATSVWAVIQVFLLGFAAGALSLWLYLQPGG